MTFSCHYCRSEMKCSATSYEENPFCTKCLPERMALAAKERGPGKWVPTDDGRYTVWVPEMPEPSQG